MRPAAEKAIEWTAGAVAFAILVLGVLVFDWLPWWASLLWMAWFWFAPATQWARDRWARDRWARDRWARWRTRRALARLRGGRR